MNEAGSVSLLGAALVGVAVALALTGAVAGSLLSARWQAQAAADAAALAAAPLTFPPAAGGRSPIGEAARLAAANGAGLVSCRCPVDSRWEPRVVRVRVTIRRRLPLVGGRFVMAESSAEFDPRRWLGG